MVSGIPRILNQLIDIIPYNDEELLIKKVKEKMAGHGLHHLRAHSWANSPGIMPRPGYLEKMRELCDEYGIVMIMDEVKTGFRVAKGGAQELLGVKGDLVTYAKAMGNGFPIAAIGGRKGNHGGK